jgi:hypothetical protein
MIPVETASGIRGGGRMKETAEEVISCMIYLIHRKNLCKCHNVPPPITTIKEKKVAAEKQLVFCQQTCMQSITLIRQQSNQSLVWVKTVN